MAERDGAPPVRVRWLIAAACVVSVLVAREGMQSVWDMTGYASPVSRFWVCNGLALIVLLSLLAAWAPPWHASRWLRVAVLLPLVHVVAIVVAGRLWLTLDAAVGEQWCCVFRRPTLPSLGLLAIVASLPIAIGLVIKRRHGEWAHAAVMGSLAFLLLLGLWMPLVSWSWVDRVQWQQLISYDGHNAFRWYRYVDHNENFLPAVVIPPALCAIAYAALSFRRAALVARYRRPIAVCLRILLGVAVFAMVMMEDANALLYLGHAYVLLVAVVVATAALVVLTAATWIASRVAYRRTAQLTPLVGTISADSAVAASFEVTSWLRGPRLDVDAFVVSTSRGDIPVTSATVLTTVPTATTALEIGERTRVLGPGDRVTLGIEIANDDGHPFRASDAGHVAMVTGAAARPYRFSEVALVVWRPAVAYLAILVAIAAPAIAMLLS